MAENQYLHFSERLSASTKTKIVDISSTSSGVMLGQIKWWGRWRQYAFFPLSGTIWNPDCLAAVTDKIGELSMDRKLERHPATTI